MSNIDENKNSGIMGMARSSKNTGAFSSLPEKMSKKHIRELAKEYNIDIKGLSLVIDKNEELLNIQYTGCANPDIIGSISFFRWLLDRKEICYELYITKKYTSSNSKNLEQIMFKTTESILNKAHTIKKIYS